jgi:chaperonin cofactor prefoldin
MGYLFFTMRVVEELEDTEGVIRIRISKKNRQHNGQKKKYERTNNDLQNIHNTPCNRSAIP